MRRLKLPSYMALCGVALLGSEASSGAELYSNADFVVRWDNTVKYSAAFRIDSRDRALLTDPNTDDGDRNFAPGLISNRLDLLSQLDVALGAIGLRVSADAWYDAAYHRRNDNHSPSTFNPFSVPHDRFTRAVKSLHGEYLELLDGFVHGEFEIAGMPISVRLGRHALLWGESLFFVENGIAGGQAPIDSIKESSVPDAYARDFLLPVTQASVILQPSAAVSLSAYYQFEWRKNRAPGSGSYFSSADYLDEGGERYILAPGTFLHRRRDQKPSSSGQFGLALQVSADDYSYGFYALRFHAKDPQIYLRPSGRVVSGDAGSYDLVYPRNIEIYGASFSSYLGDSNVAGEVSMRRRMPLVTGPIVVPIGAAADGDKRPLYPIGDTLHLEVSMVDTFAPAWLWNRADMNVEVSANQVLAVVKNSDAMDRSRDRFALAARGTFTTQYFEVLPGLDVSVPIGLGFSLLGSSATDQSQNRGAGDIELGLQATFRTAWQARVSLTHFIGNARQQPFADRDLISASLQTTF